MARRRGRLRGKEKETHSAFIPTKVHCGRDAKNTLLRAARSTKTTCMDRVVFCHEGKLFIKATCDTKGQAMAYADRVKTITRVLEKVL